MGFKLKSDEFRSLIEKLSENYRIYAPVLKAGEGRALDQDIVRYDFVTSSDEIELEEKSDYAFKEVLTPLSETLFYFTENQVKEADQDPRDIIVFLRSCDMHAVKRLDQMYLHNGRREDYFYKRIREKVHFALMGCSHSFETCFCVDMGANVTSEGYEFSIDAIDGNYHMDLADSAMDTVKEAFQFVNGEVADVTPLHVEENEVHVTVPENIPLSIIKSNVWDEYSARCINCGRCNFVCPTCTCYTMQDVYYTDNGKVGERRRVAASCMVDGYTEVAGGGQYRRTNGERMRFKVLHKIKDFKERFDYQMCVGCGRCDAVCPEYISFASCINKVNKVVEEGMKDGE